MSPFVRAFEPLLQVFALSMELVIQLSIGNGV